MKNEKLEKLLALMLIVSGQLNSHPVTGNSLDQELESLSGQNQTKIGGHVRLLAILTCCSGLSLRTIIILFECGIFAVGGLIGFALGKLL